MKIEIERIHNKLFIKGGVEEIRIIQDYPDYFITSEGRVYSIKRGKFLKYHLSNTGYYRVHLSLNNKSRKILVHRLVAEAFINNTFNKPFVNHKDENKLNNRVVNLNWCTNSENQLHGTCVNKIKTKTGLKVIRIDNYNKELEFLTIHDAAKSIKENTSTSSISKCCKGILKTAYGYKWKYKNN